MIFWIAIVVATVLFSVYVGKLLSFALQARSLKRHQGPKIRRWASTQNVLWMTIDD